MAGARVLDSGVVTQTTVQQLVAHRLRAQRLDGPPAGSPADVVRSLGAVQAQELSLALWSMGQRSGADLATVTDALDSGAVLRTHVLRPTWHFVPAEDLRWMQRLTRDRIWPQARHYARLVGADDELVGQALTVFEQTLADGAHRTRAELGAALADAGLDVPPRALPHLTLLAELEHVITSGALRDGRPTYALAAERVPTGRDLSGDEALAELTRRYLSGHGPATVRDLAWWASLTRAEARRGVTLLGDEVEWLTVQDVDYVATGWDASAEPDTEPGAGPTTGAGTHLLQPFDELVVGYSQSRWLVYADPEASRTPSAMRFPLLVDDLVVGWWTVATEASSPIRVLAARPLDGPACAAVERAAARFAAFADRSPHVEWLDTSA